jgi:hypothetical protein
MAKHVDIIRNDWVNRRQVPVANVRLNDQGVGFIVRNATPTEHYEDTVFNSVVDVISESTDSVVSALMRAFRGPYLVATDAHTDEECPFRDVAELPIEAIDVKSPYVLPSLRVDTSFLATPPPVTSPHFPAPPGIENTVKPVADAVAKNGTSKKARRRMAKMAANRVPDDKGLFAPMKPSGGKPAPATLPSPPDKGLLASLELIDDPLPGSRHDG